MDNVSRSFQIFSKPVGAVCNLGCRCCNYLKKEDLYPNDRLIRMPYDILEKYIAQHIEASLVSVIRFSWHGGEPTILGRIIIVLSWRYSKSIDPLESA
jgi:uncharacterized protein